MGKKEKLIKRLMRIPSDFTYNEACALLIALGFEEDNKGSTSGSRVCFRHPDIPQVLMFHKPHPQKELKLYVVKRIIEYLTENHLI